MLKGGGRRSKIKSRYTDSGFLMAYGRVSNVMPRMPHPRQSRLRLNGHSQLSTKTRRSKHLPQACQDSLTPVLYVPDATSAILPLMTGKPPTDAILGSRLYDLLKTFMPGISPLIDEERKGRLRVCLKSLWYFGTISLEHLSRCHPISPAPLPVRRSLVAFRP